MNEMGRIYLACVPETWIGVEAARQIGSLLKDRGFRRPLIVTDVPVAKSGLLGPVEESFGAAGLDHAIFDGSQPNGPTQAIEECAATLRRANCDSLVAVGGGSPIDIAKVASVLVTNEEGVYDFIGRDKVKRRGLFKAALPTTAGTGSEWSNSAIVTDGRDALKKPIFSRFMWCDLVLLDPLMSLHLPPRQTADTGIDALTHAIEAYAAWKATIVSDMYAEKAIELVASSLRTAYAKGPKHLEARYRLCLAAALAMAAHTSSSAGLVHAMNYPLTAKTHVSHGTALALLLPHIMDFNLIACPHKYAGIARLMGERLDGCSPIQAARRSVDAVRHLCADVGMPQALTEVGFTEGDIPDALDFLFTYQTYGMENNPRDVSREDLSRIYRAAL
jgi:alcohol dehydrogenase class IV